MDSLNPILKTGEKLFFEEADSFLSVDLFRFFFNISKNSSKSPYSLKFRKALKIGEF